MAKRFEDAARLVDLLHLPLQEGGAGIARLIVFNAPASYRLPAGFTGAATMVQPFRAAFLSLRAAGLTAVPQLQGEGADAALVALSRHRGENERMLAEAAGRLADGGLLVCAGFKADGAPSLRKRLADRIQGVDHAPKHHGVVFWMRVDAATRKALAALSEGRDSGPEGFATAAGMFSHDRIDSASALLVSALPDDLGGRIADFGAGWGYLSVSLARRFGQAVERVDLYEADFRALGAARDNMARLAPGTPAQFFWHDLRTEAIPERYDAIVTNPPFHETRAAEPEIGRDFIRAAFAALKPRGRLFLVANRGLPYEAGLEAFASAGEMVRDARYKVLWARR